MKIKFLNKKNIKDMFTKTKTIDNKSEFILDQNYVSNYFKSLKSEVNASFEEFCADSKSKNKIDINLKRDKILKKINEHETKCLKENEMFEQETIFFLDKNNCVSNYMLNRRHPYKLVIIKNDHLNIEEINLLKQKK